MSDSKALIALAHQAAAIEELLIDSNGEITPELEEGLVVKDVQLPAKVDSYAFLMDRMDSISEFYKDKSAFYAKLAKSADGVTERLKENLKFAMTSTEVEELLGFDTKFKLVKSNPACVIPDESLVDAFYITTKTTTSVDKKKIAEDLKLGVPVRGARLEQGFSLRKYANSPAKSKAVSK